MYVSTRMCFWISCGNRDAVFLVPCLPQFVHREDFYASLERCVHLTRGWRRRLASCLATLWQTHLICMFFQPRLSLLPSAKVWRSLWDLSMPAVDCHVIQGKFRLFLWDASFNPRVLKMQMFHGFLECQEQNRAERCFICSLIPAVN